MKPRAENRHGVLRITLMGGILAGIGVMIGYFGSRYIASALLAGLLKYAIGAIGIVWLFSLNVYNKLSEATDMPGLDYRQHRSLEAEIRARLHWFWMRAFFLAVLAVTLAAPSILSDAKLAVPGWVFGLSCGALALALFSLRRLWNELEEIRELRSYIKELERMEKERSDMVKALKDGLKGPWQNDAALDGFRGKSDVEQSS